jgi:hypothetical protein
MEKVEEFEEEDTPFLEKFKSVDIIKGTFADRAGPNAHGPSCVLLMPLNDAVNYNTPMMDLLAHVRKNCPKILVQELSFGGELASCKNRHNRRSLAIALHAIHIVMDQAEHVHTLGVQFHNKAMKTFLKKMQWPKNWECLLENNEWSFSNPDRRSQMLAWQETENYPPQDICVYEHPGGGHTDLECKNLGVLWKLQGRAGCVPKLSWGENHDGEEFKAKKTVVKKVVTKVVQVETTTEETYFCNTSAREFQPRDLGRAHDSYTMQQQELQMQLDVNRMQIDELLTRQQAQLQWQMDICQQRFHQSLMCAHNQWAGRCGESYVASASACSTDMLECWSDEASSSWQ